MALYLIPNSTKASIGTVTLDASISERHLFTSQVPSYPVEVGKPITDDVIKNPITVEITGFVSNVGGAQLKADTAFKQLQLLYKNSLPVSVVTSAKTYSDMVMSSLDVPRVAGAENSLRFTATLQEIVRADVATVTVEKVKPAVKKKVAPKKVEPKAEPQIYKETTGNYRYQPKSPTKLFKPSALG